MARIQRIEDSDAEGFILSMRIRWFYHAGDAAVWSVTDIFYMAEAS